MAKNISGRKIIGSIEGAVVLVTAAYEGMANATTVSMVAGLSFRPPLVCISLSHRSFSRSLIEDSGEFAINIVSPAELDLVKKIGATSGHKVDKFKEFGVKTRQAEIVKCPLIELAHTTLECNVTQVIDLGRQDLFIAEVVSYQEFRQDSPIYLYHGKYFTLGKQIGTYYG
ncbi:MAG: flavin reductase family protein [Firmicutes bacterium]|nr:flavin reductase family protein [Bacillota bacterium]